MFNSESKTKEAIKNEIQHKVKTEGYVSSGVGFIEYGTEKLSLQALAGKVLELETIITKLRSRLGL